MDENIKDMISDKDPKEMTTLERAQEYFQIKKVLKDLRSELKELRENHEVWEELQKVSEKAKRLRLELRDDLEMSKLDQKVDSLRERQKLLKEIIKMELIKSGETEVKGPGRKLKIVQELKEMKDEEDFILENDTKTLK
jgi:hypothetical protein